LQALSPTEFWSSASEGLKAMDVDEKDALVYVHGFNTSFVESMLRAAQFGHDLKFPGIATAFSWPSKGQLLLNSYTADSATIGAHCSYVADFIAGLLSRTNCRKVHILGHSLGSLAVLKGCAATRAFSRDHAKRIGQVIYAAADVDDQEFVKYAAKTPSIRTTLYASAKDSALKLSSGWNSFKRAGLLPPPTVVRGVDTIDVGAVDISAMGHGYVAETHAVLYDMFALIRHNTPPSDRIRLRPTMHGSASYWKLV
jgi:esterase/lipase superfamily enzyme